MVLNKSYSVLIMCALITSQRAPAQTPRASQRQIPRFEDYPVPEKWQGPAAPVKLTTASERMFATRLREASKQPPDFAVTIALQAGAAAPHVRQEPLLILRRAMCINRHSPEKQADGFCLKCRQITVARGTLTQQKAGQDARRNSQ